MGLSQHGYLVLCYTLGCVLVAAFAVYAFVTGHRLHTSRGVNSTVSGFITAKRQVSTVRIAFSFFAGALGAWAISGPSYFTAVNGITGLVMYSTMSGLPVLLIAFAGGFIRVRAWRPGQARAAQGSSWLVVPGCWRRQRVLATPWPQKKIKKTHPCRALLCAPLQEKLPGVMSMTDFVGWRFGAVAKVYVVLVILLNMSIGGSRCRPAPEPVSLCSAMGTAACGALVPWLTPGPLAGAAMLSDFSAMGALFGPFLGGPTYPIIIVVGLVTMAYTTYGGLLVSIYTDVLQGQRSAAAGRQQAGRLLRDLPSAAAPPK